MREPRSGAGTWISTAITIALTGLVISTGSAKVPQMSTGTVVAANLQNSTSTVLTSFAGKRQAYYEVAPDGSRAFTELRDALAAASDPNIHKVIMLYPGTYTIPDDTQVTVTVARTHIVGVSRDAVRIEGSMPTSTFPGSGPSGGLIVINASDCSMENLTVRNRAKESDHEAFKSTALRIGHFNGDTVKSFRAENCAIIGITPPSEKEGWAYDVIWNMPTSEGAEFIDCEIVGSSDIISNMGKDLRVTGGVVKVNLSGGGYPFWTSSSTGTLYGNNVNPTMTVTGTEIRGVKAPFGYVVFGGGGNVSLTNVNETLNVKTRPDYFVGTPGTTGTLSVNGVFGQPPKEMQKVQLYLLR